MNLKNDFFASTIDESLVDSTISAFNNVNYDITHKQKTKWKKDKGNNNNNGNNESDSRFIPIRDENKFDEQQMYHLKNGDSSKEKEEESCSKNKNKNKKILSFKSKAPLSEDGYISNLRTIYTTNTEIKKLKKNNIRYINETATRVLDAPDLMDDFYLNLLDWGTNNIIGIGLSQSIYLWNALNGEINVLKEYSETSDIYICSIKYNHNSQYIAIGTSDNIITLYDSKTFKPLRKLYGHSSRISSLSWNHSILSSGSADSNIRNHDVRQKNYLISIFSGHEQEVCGLKWNNNINAKYLASGSNDNKCCIWDFRNNNNNNNDSNCLFEFTDSLSAVKALSWCPWNNNLLATGGGSGDRKIRIYNINSNGNLCNIKDTQSQVCSLLWNPFEKELLSSHGFTKNQLSIWKYPSLTKTHDLTGHNSRVLHTTLSPNKQIVCSAAADETLRFWNVFEPPKNNHNNNQNNQNNIHKIKNNSNSLNLRIR